MNQVRRLFLRLGGLFTNHRHEAEMTREMESHLVLIEDDYVRQGMTQRDARAAARRAYGGVEQAKQKHREERSFPGVMQIMSDLRFAARAARKSPLLTSVAILALSIGIGLNAGVFTLLNAMFLSPPTRQDPGSFTQLYAHYEGWFPGTEHYSGFTTEDFDAIRSRATTLKQVAASRGMMPILEQGQQGVPGSMVSCNYFSVFGENRPLLGRLLIENDCKRGTAAQVLVLNEGFWARKFNSDPAIVGKAIHLNGVPFTVVGVLRSQSANFQTGYLFVPYTVQPVIERHSENLLSTPDSPWLQLSARLQSGVERATAQAEVTGIMRQQDRAYLARKVSTLNRKTSVGLTNGSFIENPAMRGGIATGLMTLIMGPLVLVLLLACTNVTVLFLSRALARRGELAVRMALGAGRQRLLRMLVLESLLIASVAGVLSLALAYYVPIILINAIDPNSIMRTRMDWHVLIFLALLVAIAAVVSSLAPAQASWTLDLLTALKGREGAVTVRSKVTNSLIVAQVAMSFVLLAAAVLFGRLPGEVTAMDPGFDTRHVLVVPLESSAAQRGHTAALNYQKTVVARVEQIAGVQSIAFAEVRPFEGASPVEIRLPGQAKGQGTAAVLDHVSAGFFSTFEVPMLRGRQFTASDETPSQSSANVVVSKAFAEQFWPGGDPLGKVITTPEEKRYTVIGIAADTRSQQFGVLDGPRLYLPQDPDALADQVFVRFNGSASTMEAAAREGIKAIDATVLTTPQTIWETLLGHAEELRSLAHITLVMASVAVIMAIAGIYAVLSFAMQQRKREFGIRVVLGADRASIFRSVLLRGGLQVAIGLAGGVLLATPASWGFVRIAKNSPFPFQSFDITVYGIAAALLMFVSLAAMYLPASRATDIDPAVALRNE